jgi:hypothetical protein
MAWPAMCWEIVASKRHVRHCECSSLGHHTLREWIGGQHLGVQLLRLSHSGLMLSSSLLWKRSRKVVRMQSLRHVYSSLRSL